MPIMNLMGFVAVMLVFVSVGRLHDALAQFTGALPAAKALIAFGAIAFLMKPKTRILSEATTTPQGKSFLVFVSAIIISLPFSYYRNDSVSVASLYLFASVPIMIFIACSIETFADIERLMRAAVVMVVLAGLIIVSGFGTTIDTVDGPRVSLSGSYDPNDLALVIGSCTAFCVWAIKDRSVFWKFAGVAGIVSGSFVVVKTASRGGGLALGLMVLLATFCVRNAVPRWFRALILPLAIAAFFAAPESYRTRLSTVTNTSEDYNTFDEGGRIKIWKRGIGYFVARPLTGVGVGQFGQAEGRFAANEGITGGWKWSAPHNMYVEVAAELGILGIAGLLGIFLTTLRQTWRVMRMEVRSQAQEREVRVAGALFLSTSGFMVAAIFLTAALSPLALFLTALGIRFQTLSERSGVRSRATIADRIPDPTAAWLRSPRAMQRGSRWTGRPATHSSDRTA